MNIKKLLYLSLSLLITTCLFFVSCNDDKDDNNSFEETIVGRWLFDVGANLPNTMYEFIDDTRYTYYAATNDWSVEYWQSLDTSDAIPGTNDYTFEDDVLTIDLNFGNTQVLPLIFECDGDRINFQDPDSPDRYDWVRLGADLNNCD
ncbi:MAG: hypothetical protein HN773_01200 [Flavobacteriaceae bacterium]|mgnify:CR=1 FL=1|jgi:hypothetical protein|nr:hypothetical protein [Flavobacteriaceae bacterium]MBT5097062.1 hypothetical protein [Candidatus Neomarinimicrobiota bacterium]MBT4113447.1 hypothetical protein [Flavobacteriaceae bacterium]MBT4613547.1 hypothetical protein [Flavobacteriaceae bacterium]MBT5650471.1 hypothetical protein [Flavobacteriaceae bacterium]|tara:strand:- start:3749 stop:4189 length:441 start_codon:yes stop_codon:yes gene_type:complete